MRRDPYLDNVMRGWIVNVARANFFKISGYDFADLVQEGYERYYACHATYVGKRKRLRDGTPARFLPKRNPDKTAVRHFQALVKTDFMNRISDLKRKNPRHMEQHVCDMPVPDGVEEPTEAVMLETIMPPQYEEATAFTLWQSMPKEFLQLFRLLASDAEVALRALTTLSGRRVKTSTGDRPFICGSERVRLRVGKARCAPRESANQYYCRKLGLEPGYDLIGAVEKHFLDK